jgi:hypothetical protein
MMLNSVQFKHLIQILRETKSDLCLFCSIYLNIKNRNLLSNVSIQSLQIKLEVYWGDKDVDASYFTMAINA